MSPVPDKRPPPANPTILHVIPSFRVGGAEHTLAALVAAKRDEAFQQVVVNLSGEGKLEPSAASDSLKVINLRLRHAGAVPITTLHLARLIRRIRPNAIQSWLYYADLLSLWALRLSGQRRSSRLYWGIRNSALMRKEYSVPLRWSIAACAHWSGEPDAVVSNSYAARAAHLELGYRPRAFPVIPNGIDTERYRGSREARDRVRASLGIPDSASVVLHAARLDPMKDHPSLLAVAARMPDITFIMAGDGTDRLSRPSNVVALGPRHDMPDLFAAADIALSTSAFGEAFPNVVAEAMSTGLPVVATAVGDAPRIVGDAGLIVRPRDVPGMAEALRSLLAETESARRQRGGTGRARIAAHFSLARMVSAFDNLHLRGVLPAEAATVGS